MEAELKIRPIRRMLLRSSRETSRVRSLRKLRARPLAMSCSLFRAFQIRRSCRMYCCDWQDFTTSWTSSSLTFTPGRLSVIATRSLRVRFFRLVHLDTFLSQ
uniref:Uncharacterized protein n=1 Tax=Anguilla anguilla TaxID=7936 RepID=A0A0E9PMM9_ANGAN